MGVLRKLFRDLAIAWHRPKHWRFRPGTFDRRAFRNVVVENEYRLPHRLPAGIVVLDIGANIGAFALAALRRGADRVECFEPDPENFEQLSRNLAPFAPKVSLHRAAVWRSDVRVSSLSLHNPVGGGNTGAVQVTSANGPTAPALAFDDLLAPLVEGDLVVKLDCEGAEWPILFTSRHLRRIRTLLGEYHLGPLPEVFSVAGAPERSPEALQRFLEEHGFRTTLVPNGESPHGLGHFFAFPRDEKELW